MLPPLRSGPDLTDTGGMALLERELPLTSLADYADEARRGDGRAVLVSGEAGVGKSALLEEFAARLSDALWCWGARDARRSEPDAWKCLDESMAAADGTEDPQWYVVPARLGRAEAYWRMGELTAARHVSAVLAKLGVPTRRAAAEAAASAGVSPAPRDTTAAHGAG